ncbi:MAG: hypothetical protein U0414_26845 [Polyangiaceae bacterium]
MNLRTHVIASVLCIASITVFGSGCRATVHAGGGHAGSAQPSGPRVLGERMVDGALDHDAIEVAGNERFSRIEIAVNGSALEMFDVVVTFGNGERFSPPTRLVFDNHSSSRIIDLPGGERDIRRIDFRYGNLPGGGRAHVVVRGM